MHLSPSFRYDQPEVLVREVAARLRARHARSLLDIGAGSGGVAVPLSKEVARYLAIEARAPAAAALRAAGLEVVEARFPVDLDERFDVVLSSHSIPEDGPELYGPFLGRAWDLVAPGGLLLVITFKGVDDSAVQLLAERLAGRSYGSHPHYPLLISILNTCGPVERTRIDSHVRTAEASDLVAFFGHWFSDAREGDLEHILAETFRDGAGYCVPTPHLVLAVSKPTAPAA